MERNFLTQRIKKILKTQGFGLSGIAPVDPKPQDVDFWKLWIVDKRHGEMAYLENPLRNSILQWYPEAQSVVMAALFYQGPYQKIASNASDNNGRKRREDEGFGKIAGYARYPDYHRVITTKLKMALAQIQKIEPKADGKIFTDSSPILERSYARLAGIGWMGKNTLIIHPRRGSYFFLGGVALNLDLKKDPEALGGYCGACTRCLDACPTQCLKPYQMDARRCISYMTIEKKTIPTELELMEKTQQWVFGCDVCAHVCPYNRFQAQGTKNQENNILDSPKKQKNPDEDGDWKPIQPSGVPLKTVLSWSEKDYQDYFAGTPVRRAKWRVFLKNTMIAVANTGQKNCLDALERWEHDKDSEIAQLAKKTKERILRTDAVNLNPAAAQD